MNVSLFFSNLISLIILFLSVYLILFRYISICSIFVIWFDLLISAGHGKHIAFLPTVFYRKQFSVGLLGRIIPAVFPWQPSPKPVLFPCTTALSHPLPQLMALEENNPSLLSYTQNAGFFFFRSGTSSVTNSCGTSAPTRE